MFCENNKLPWWGGLKHIVVIAIIIVLKNGEIKGKITLPIHDHCIDNHFFHQTPLNIGAILSNTPLFPHRTTIILWNFFLCMQEKFIEFKPLTPSTT
jgi:hypothetical protein